MSKLAPMHAWLTEPMPSDVAEAVDRLRRAPDVQHVAVMPDVHLASDVCVGVAMATSSLLYPQAVGGDIGCGMLAVAFDMEAAAVTSRVLDGLREVIPARRRKRSSVVESADFGALSHSSLETVRRGDGVLQFATLGSGNHFIELQSDEDGRLWLMLHSGSRAMGQAILKHHLARGQPVGGGLRAIEAASDAGAAYLSDVAWARRYAVASRRAMAELVAGVVNAAVDWSTLIVTDHNHVEGGARWVHRKGAMAAHEGVRGVLPGSMGTLSFHVEGRGNTASLCSSAHGAGRALSRTEAHQKVSERELRRQMEGVWYESRYAGQLRDEAPSAYKDIRAVLRAQRDLVKVIRTLKPVLNYKGVL